MVRLAKQKRIGENVLTARTLDRIQQVQTFSTELSSSGVNYRFTKKTDRKERKKRERERKAKKKIYSELKGEVLFCLSFFLSLIHI